MIVAMRGCPAEILHNLSVAHRFRGVAPRRPEKSRNAILTLFCDEGWRPSAGTVHRIENVDFSCYTGDLFVVFHVDEKRGIWREGLHLYSKINIDFTEAILGSVKEVETVEGFRDLKIPSGIQHGHSVKLSRLGVPDMNKPSIRGDHYFVVNVHIPKDISGMEHALVEQLASLTASRRGHSFSSDDSGIPKGKFNDFMWRDTKSDASSEGTKTSNSLWGSIKNILRISACFSFTLPYCVSADAVRKREGKASANPIIEHRFASAKPVR
ncbi:unnamed protein product [Trifolium pratense]|uniref:Uncharacterized protein n=1 Tax=Trifolium pratense TaxID=57577 RepID=A0ACB0JD28_TRIPR|nr:unnamed protein product [Trifolium pratense]